MLSFKEFLLLEDSSEVTAIKDYLSSFSPLDNVTIKSKGDSILVKVKTDIDSSMKYVDKALIGIGYEIDKADNDEEGNAEYTCIPLKD